MDESQILQQLLKQKKSLFRFKTTVAILSVLILLLVGLLVFQLVNRGNDRNDESLSVIENSVSSENVEVIDKVSVLNGDTVTSYKNPLTQFYVDELENNYVGGKKYTADGWGYYQTPYKLVHHYSGDVVDSGVGNYQRIEVIEYEMRDDEGGNLRAIITGVKFYYRKNPNEKWNLSKHVIYKGTGAGLVCENLDDDEKKAFAGIYGCMSQETGESVTISWR
jgi:hypothetical protein